MSKIRFIISLVQFLVVIGSSCSTALGADEKVTAELLLQKAVYAQQSQGDLDRAIELYSQVITQTNTDRQYAAQACYELGQCYQSKGDKSKAIEYYRKTATDYNDVEMWQKKAYQKLTEMGELVGVSDPGIEMINNVPPEIKNAIGSLFSELVKEANQQQCAHNSHYYLVEDDLEVRSGVINSIENREDVPKTGKIRLGITSYNTRRYYTIDGIPLEVEYTPVAGQNNTWSVYITLLEPLLPQENLVYVTISETPHAKRNSDGEVSFTMQNFYGRKCLESFFLIARSDMKIVSESEPYTDKVEVKTQSGDYTIYNYKKLVGYGQNHKVDIKVSGKIDDEQSPLNLLPAPWSDGDSFKLDIKLKTGVSIGSLSYSFNTVEKEGKEYWQIAGDQEVDAGTGKTEQKTIVLADKDTYRPVYGSTVNALGSFEADYAVNKVWLKREGSQRGEIKISGPVFDNEQVLCMLRMLPLTDTYTCKFDIFPVLSGVVIECQIKVIGTETVTVPAGVFPCYKVSLSCWSDQTKILEHYIWIEKDIAGSKQHIIKYDARTVEMVLTEVNGETSTMISEGPAGAIISSATSLVEKDAARKLAAEGWKLWQQRELVQAQEKFQQAIAKDPENDNGFQGLGWTLFNQGLNDKAKEAFIKCIAINPENSAALNGLGWIAKANGDTDQAVEYWKKAIEAFPGATASLSGLVEHYLAISDYSNVIKYAKMWLEAEPDNSDVKQKLESAREKLKQK